MYFYFLTFISIFCIYHSLVNKVVCEVFWCEALVAVCCCSWLAADVDVESVMLTWSRAKSQA